MVALVQAEDFVVDLPPGLTSKIVSETKVKAILNREQILQRNGQLGVPTYLLRRSKSLSRSLAQPVVR